MLALISPTSGGHSVDIVRSRTRATELFLRCGPALGTEGGILCFIMKSEGGKSRALLQPIGIPSLVFARLHKGILSWLRELNSTLAGEAG
jgi:hypothetical protein